jgi:hypothetical protein
VNNFPVVVLHALVNINMQLYYGLMLRDLMLSVQLPWCTSGTLHLKCKGFTFSYDDHTVPHWIRADTSPCYYPVLLKLKTTYRLNRSLPRPNRSLSYTFVCLNQHCITTQLRLGVAILSTCLSRVGLQHQAIRTIPSISLVCSRNEPVVTANVARLPNWEANATSSKRQAPTTSARQIQTICVETPE